LSEVLRFESGNNKISPDSFEKIRDIIVEESGKSQSG
jgi:hypothetical protein